MFLDLKQRADVCRAIVRSAGKGELRNAYTARPTTEALQTERAGGGSLFSGEYLALRVALAVWRDDGGPTLHEVLRRGGDFAAMNDGPESIDKWLEDTEGRQPEEAA